MEEKKAQVLGATHPKKAPKTRRTRSSAPVQAETGPISVGRGCLVTPKYSGWWSFQSTEGQWGGVAGQEAR